MRWYISTWKFLHSDILVDSVLHSTTEAEKNIVLGSDHVDAAADLLT